MLAATVFLFLLSQIRLEPVGVVNPNTTSPDVSQVPAFQVRIGDRDIVPGTLVTLEQIKGKYHTRELQTVPWVSSTWAPSTAPDKLVICVWSVIRGDLDGIFTPRSAMWVPLCLSEIGQNLALTDPQVRTWYEEQER